MMDIGRKHKKASYIAGGPLVWIMLLIWWLIAGMWNLVFKPK